MDAAYERERWRVFHGGRHAFDLARWLASARGQRLDALRMSTSTMTGAADFPWWCRSAAPLPNGVRVETGADLRDDAPFRLEIAIDGRSIDLSAPEWPRPFPEQDGASDVEYAGLVGDFIRAVRCQAVD